MTVADNGGINRQVIDNAFSTSDPRSALEAWLGQIGADKNRSFGNISLIRYLENLKKDTGIISQNIQDFIKTSQFNQQYFLDNKGALGNLPPDQLSDVIHRIRYTNPLVYQTAQTLTGISGYLQDFSDVIGSTLYFRNNVVTDPIGSAIALSYTSKTLLNNVSPYFSEKITEFSEKLGVQRLLSRPRESKGGIFSLISDYNPLRMMADVYQGAIDLMEQLDRVLADLMQQVQKSALDIVNQIIPLEKIAEIFFQINNISNQISQLAGIFGGLEQVNSLTAQYQQFISLGYQFSQNPIQLGLGLISSYSGYDVTGVLDSPLNTLIQNGERYGFGIDNNYAYAGIINGIRGNYLSALVSLFGDQLRILGPLQQIIDPLTIPQNSTTTLSYYVSDKYILNQYGDKVNYPTPLQTNEALSVTKRV